MNKTNQKRLARDIVDILKNPLTDNGIYYKHDENDMLKGYAMIMGPEDSIYNYGYYIFKLNFTKEYPFKPPTLTYLTNEHNIRFHPNLYKNGKVCLSILNTWSGEQWTSSQTIRSVLLTLVTLFHNKPLLCEPGITENYKYFKLYNEMIEYSNFNTAVNSIIGYIENKNFSDSFKNVIYSNFKETIKENYEKNKEKIKEKLEIKIKEKSLLTDIKDRVKTISLYNNMTCDIDYNKVYNTFITIYESENNRK